MANKISNSIAGLANTFNKIGNDLEAKERREEAKRREDDLIDRRNKDAENRIQLADASAGLTEKIETGYAQFDAKLEEQRFQGLATGEAGKSSFDSVAFLRDYESDIMDSFESNFDIEQTDYNQAQAAQAKSTYIKTRQNVRSQLRAKYAENQTKHIEKRFTARSAVLLDVLDGKVDNGEDPRAAFNAYVEGITELQKIVGEPIVIGQSANGELITHSPFLGETAIQMSLRFNGARQTVSSLVSAGKFEEAQSFYEGLTTGAEGSSVEDFIEKLTFSESRGRSDAKHTDETGRSHVGLIQFGELRLTDFRKATGREFTQEEFRKDVKLQTEVGLWHINDIDKKIKRQKESNPELFETYNNLDGLRAVAHLSGMGKNWVPFLKGKGNTRDALNTSQRDYYKRFANGDVQGTSSLHGVNKQGVSYRRLLGDAHEQETKAQIENVITGIGASEKEIRLFQQEHDQNPRDVDTIDRLKSYSNQRLRIVTEALTFHSDNPEMNLLDEEQQVALERHREAVITGKILSSSGRVSSSNAASFLANAPVGQRATAFHELISQQPAGQVNSKIIKPVIEMLESSLSENPELKRHQIQDRKNIVSTLSDLAELGRIPLDLKFTNGGSLARFVKTNAIISNEELLILSEGNIDKSIKTTVITKDSEGDRKEKEIDVAKVTTLILGSSGIQGELSDDLITRASLPEQQSLTIAVENIKHNQNLSTDEALLQLDRNLKTLRNADVVIRPGIKRPDTEEEARLNEVGLVALVANAMGETFDTQEEYIDFAQSFIAIPVDAYAPNNSSFRIVHRQTGNPMMSNFVDMSEVYALKEKGIFNVDQLMDNIGTLMNDTQEELGIRDAASRWNGKKSEDFFYRLFDFFDIGSRDQLGDLGNVDANGNPKEERNALGTILASESSRSDPGYERTRLNVLINSPEVLEKIKDLDPRLYEDIIKIRQGLKRFGHLSHIQVFPDYIEEITAGALEQLYVRASLYKDREVGDISLTPTDLRSLDIVNALSPEERARRSTQGSLEDVFSVLFPDAVEKDKITPGGKLINRGIDFVKFMAEQIGGGAFGAAEASASLAREVLGVTPEETPRSQKRNTDQSREKAIVKGAGRLSNARFLTIRRGGVDAIIDAANKDTDKGSDLIATTTELTPRELSSSQGDLTLKLVDNALSNKLSSGQEYEILDSGGASLSVKIRPIDGDTVSITSSNEEKVMILPHMPDDTHSLEELTVIDYKLNKGTNLRVAGQDAPEVKKAWMGEPGEDGGNESYVFLVESTEGKQVYVQVFPTVDGKDLMRDKYNRVVGGLNAGGKDLTEASLQAGLTEPLIMGGYGIHFGVEEAKKYSKAAQQGNDFALGLYSETSPTVERKAYSHLEQQALENKKGQTSTPFQPLFLPVPDGNGAGFLIGNSYPNLGILKVDLKNVQHTETLIKHFRKLSKKREFLPFSDEASAKLFIAESAKYIYDPDVSPVYKSVRLRMREHTNRASVQNKTDMLIKEFPEYTGLEIAQAVQRSAYGRKRSSFRISDLRRFLELEREER